MTVSLMYSALVIFGCEMAALNQACWHGKLDEVQRIVAQGCDPKKVRDVIGLTPLHYACSGGNLGIMRYLIEEQGCSPKCEDQLGSSLLHDAARDNQLEIAAYLLTKGYCNVNTTSHNGQTPLEIAQSPEMIRLLLKYGAKPTYEQWGKYLAGLSDSPSIESVIKVFVLGNSGAGKSTLIKSLVTERKGFYHLVNLFSQVSGVDKCTVGIIPHAFKSEQIGSVVLYDFAGHKEFYAGHDALLRNAIAGSPSVLFLIVIDLREEDDHFKSTLLYWVGFIGNFFSENARPCLIVVGSHYDQLENSKLRLKQAFLESIENIKPYRRFNLAGYLTLDCRYSESASLAKLRTLFTDTCRILKGAEMISYRAHCFLIYLLSIFQDSIAVTVDTVLNRASIDFNLHDDYRSICHICEQLNQQGHILFMKNSKSPEKSWIVLDQKILLSLVTGTVFAPQGFKEYSETASSTGVVPFSKLLSQLPDLDPSMFTQFLCHLEFCHEITDTEILALLQTQPSSLEERYFFFPGLVCLNMPKDVWESSDQFSYHTGWVLQCSRPEQFFTSRLLQVLLLRLTFLFTLAPNLIESGSTPTLHRRCCVWKSGISWSDRTGVEALVGVVDQKRIIVLMRCQSGGEMALINLRSSIIRKVICVKDEYCPTVNAAEWFIQSRDAIRYPGEEFKTTCAVSLQELSIAVVNGKKFAFDEAGKLVEIQNLLHFEPFADLNARLLHELFDEDQQNYHEDIKDEFFYRIADKAHHKTDEFHTLFNCSLSRLENLVSQAPPGITHKLVRVFLLWRESQEEGSRCCFRKALDEYSVFAGRNLLNIQF